MSEVKYEDLLHIISLIRSCRQVSHVKRIHASLTPPLKQSTKIRNHLIHAYAKCDSMSDASTLFHSMESDKRNLFSWNIMLSAYAQAGHMVDAELLFDRMPQRNLVSWNTMINAYAQHEDGHRAFLLYRNLLLHGLWPDRLTFVAVLQSGENLLQAQLVDDHVVCCGLECNLLVATALVSFYGRCGRVEVASRCFSRIKRPDVVLCNALLTALWRNGKLVDAERMFNNGMSNKDVATFTAMVTGYALNGHIHEARLTFENSPFKNVISWNAMIAAHADSGDYSEALELFERMKREPGVIPNRVTCLALLDVCGRVKDLERGRGVEELACEIGIGSDVIYSNALLNMYGRCGDLEAAKAVFCSKTRNLVSWNSMLAAYARNGEAAQAMQLFREMDLQGVGLTSTTLSTLFDACGDSESLPEGRLVHHELLGSELLSETPVCNSLITMYGKCSSLAEAELTFESMMIRNVITWTGMITAYAQNGHSRHAVELLERMSLEGMEPNQVTFVTILSACSHAGMSKQGVTCFVSMIQDYGLTPLVDHYVCVVDMLGRTGEVEEAKGVIGHMPFEPHPVAWTSLLGACKVHKARGLGSVAAQEFRSMEPDKDAPYVMQSNLWSV